MPERQRAAFIQAGHAVGARLCDIPVIRVSIVPIEGADSWIDIAEPTLPATGPLIRERDRRAARGLTLLAGAAAGQRYSFGAA